MRTWESDKPKSWSIPAEGLRDHFATDGSLLGVAGTGGACGWSVVQLGHDEEMGPMHGMYATLDAELEVQHTIQRAELTAFLCLLRKAIGPMMVHVRLLLRERELDLDPENSKGSKGGRQKTMLRLFHFKKGKKKKHGPTVAPEPVKRPGKDGYTWVYPVCMR